MSADVPNRSAARKALGGLLKTALTGSGKPAQEVYSYAIDDFEGQSPVVAIASGPAIRTKVASSGRNLAVDSTFMLDIHLFVQYTKVAEGVHGNVSWTEEQSEDQLDALEKEVYDTLVDNALNSNWEYILSGEESIMDPVVIGTTEYRHEIIKVMAKS
jgi:hypothetical protein